MQSLTTQSNIQTTKKPNTDHVHNKKKRKQQPIKLTNDYLEYTSPGIIQQTVFTRDKNNQKRYMVKENNVSSQQSKPTTLENLDGQKKVQIKLKDRKIEQQDSKFLVKISPQNSLFSQVKDNPINAFNLKKILDQVQITKSPQQNKSQKSKKIYNKEIHTKFLSNSVDHVLPLITPKTQMTKTFIRTEVSKKEISAQGMPPMPSIGIGSLLVPNVELRGQYKNQLKGSFVKRGVYQPRKTQAMVPHGLVKSSMGTFSQARRDLAPSVDNGLTTNSRYIPQSTSFNFNLGEQEELPQRRQPRNKRLLESLDSGLGKMVERNNESWRWQIEEKYEYTSKSSREPDQFASQAPESRKLPLLSTHSGPQSQNQQSFNIKSGNGSLKHRKDFELVEQLKKRNSKQIENWADHKKTFDGPGKDYEGEHLREQSDQQAISGHDCDSDHKSEGSLSVQSEPQEEAQYQDEFRDDNPVNSDDDIGPREENNSLAADPLLGTNQDESPPEDEIESFSPLCEEDGGSPEIMKLEQGSHLQIETAQKASIANSAILDENEMIPNKKPLVRVPEGEDQGAPPSQLLKPAEKPVQSDPVRLFVDGYRASTQTNAPQWASATRRGPYAPSKQAKVLPQLSKPTITGPPDVTFVARSRKAARQRPASLLVVLFEGVLATNDREQNIADAGADFYEDSEEEETDDESEENEGSQGEQRGTDGRAEQDQRVKPAARREAGDSKGQEGASSGDSRGQRESVKPKTKKDANGAVPPKQQTVQLGGHQSQQNALETIREESPRAPSRAEKSTKKTMPHKKAKKKKKRALQKAETVVFEESSQIMPAWMTRDDKGVQKPQLPGHCLYFRHGLARGLSKLKQEFFIVILLQRKNSVRRRKQIIRALEEQDLHFDAVYQHNSLFCGDSRGDSVGGSRFFSIDWIVQDTGYSPARTVFLTSVDQSQYNYDINEYLEKDMLPPKFEPKPHDFGLLPLPYTVSALDEDERGSATDTTGFRLDIHKLVVIGVPHVLQNNDQPSLNKSKAISFKQICCMIKNFNQLCLSFENTPSPEGRSDSELPDEEMSQSGSQPSEGSEESSMSWSQPKYIVKEKYRRIFEPQRQVNPREPALKPADDVTNPNKSKAQNIKEQNDQQMQATQPEDTGQEKGDETKAKQRRDLGESSFDDDESSETDDSELLIKEPKVFYKGFKKAREHSMFSLIYQSFPLLAQKAMSERFISCLLRYRSKLTKIDGLACRLIRLKERQALEDKEYSMASPYQQQSSAKDNVQRYEALRRQPGLQASMQHLRTYYKEIYDECVLPHSKLTGQASAKDGGASVHATSQIQSQMGPSSAQHPTLDQLRRLRSCYAHEVAAIEKLMSDSAIDFQKSFNIMSLSGQLYTAKRMTNYGASSEFQFKAKLIVAGQQQQQQQHAVQRREAKELLADPEEEEHVQAEQEASLEQRRGSAPNLQNCGIFSSVDGKRITYLRNQIPVEQVRNVLDWLSKKAPAHQVQYQIIQPN